MKQSRLKKGAIHLLTTTMLLNVGFMPNVVMAGPTEQPFNYAEAFQKSMYFYDANKCGPGVSEGRLSWRGDCHTEDASNLHKIICMNTMKATLMKCLGSFHIA